MTEAEWLACADPPKMLDWLGTKATSRKVRLFACACCRLIWSLLRDERSRRAIEVAERFADGMADSRHLEEARRAAEAAATAAQPHLLSVVLRIPVLLRRREAKWNASQSAAWVVRESASVPEFWGAWYGVYWAAEGNVGLISRLTTKRTWDGWQIPSVFVRCVFGNPFRPVSFDPSWRTSTVLALATGIYDDRAFDRLPILADALQDAGCDNPDILTHLRGGGEHVRGCWALDLVLGKE